MGFAADAQERAVVGGFDAVDLLQSNEEHAAGRLDRESNRLLAGLAQFVEQRHEQDAVASLRGQMFPCAVERLAKSLVVKRFQETVESVDCKRSHGVLVIGGCGNRDGHRLRRKRFGQSEPVHHGQLDVEK